MGSRRILVFCLVALALLVPLSGSARFPALGQATPSGDATPIAADEVAIATLLRAVTSDLPTEPVVELSRLTVEPGARWELVVPGPVLYLVESGALGLSVDGAARIVRASTGTPTDESTEAGIDYTIRQGDQAVIPAATSYTLVNDGERPVQALATVTFASSTAVPSWLPAGDLPPGVALQPIAADVFDDPALAGGRVEIVVARATLAPGAALPADWATRRSLLVVESGRVGLTTGGAPESTLEAGNVARNEGGPASAVRNAGDSPLVLLIVSLTPEAATGATPAAATPLPTSTAEALLDLLVGRTLPAETLPSGFAALEPATEAPVDDAAAVGRVEVVVTPQPGIVQTTTGHRLVLDVYDSAEAAAVAFAAASEATTAGGERSQVAGFDYAAVLLTAEPAADGSRSVVCLVQASAVLVAGVVGQVAEADTAQAAVEATQLAGAGVHFLDDAVLGGATG